MVFSEVAYSNVISNIFVFLKYVIASVHTPPPLEKIGERDSPRREV